MKKIFAVVSVVFAGLVAAAIGLRDKPPAQASYALQEGDIVFHGNAGEQCDAIREATGSPYTHCGVVFAR